MSRPIEPPARSDAVHPLIGALCTPDHPKDRRSTGLLRLFALVALVLWAAIAPAPAHAVDPAIEALRIEQQKQLDSLKTQYHDKVRSNPALVKPDGTIDTSHPEYQKTLADYAEAKAQIQSTFSQQDPRGAELAEITKTFGKDVDPTGSAPKDVRADLDITANTAQTATAIVDKWKANHDVVEYDPKLGIYVNKTKDATLWAPPTPEQLAARSTYSDSFSTPGGKKATGVKGDEAISDKEGFVLDNEKKFIHAAGDLTKPAADDSDPTKASLDHATALKTAGKSVSKAADSVGQTSEVAQQADGLRNYKDEFETGVTALGATPEQQQQDVRTYIQKADQQIQNSKAKAEQQSATTKETREDLAKQAQGKDKTAIATQGDEPPAPLSPTSQAIRNRNARVNAENAKAKAANEAERKKAGLAPPPPPNDEAVGTVTKPTTPPNATTDEKEGSAKNAWWKISTAKDGDTKTTTKTTVTDTPDGGHQITVTEAKTAKTADGGKTTTQTSENTTLGKGGGVTGKTTTQSSTEAPGTQGKEGKGYITPTSKTQTQTTSTQADGTTKQTTSAGETGKTKGGGTVGSESSTTTQAGADGAKTQTTQKTSSYAGPAKEDGKQAGVTTAKTNTTQTGADGTTQTTTGKAVTHTNQDGKGKTTAKTTDQSQTSTSGADGGSSSSKSVTLTTKTTGPDGETQGHTFTSTKSTSTTASGKTSTTDSESTVDTDGTGGKTTATTSTTKSPYTTTKTGTWDYEQTHSGQDEPEGDKKPAAGGSEPVKKGVKWAGGKLFEPVDDDGGRAASTSGATQTTIGGKNTEVEGEVKVQVGQVGAKGQWEITTDNKEGTKVNVEASGEIDVVKVTGSGSAQVDLTEDISAQTKVTATAKVGAEAKGAVSAALTTEKVVVAAEAKAFVGGKAELEAEASMTFWGLKLAGKGQGEVSYGAGGEARIEGELTWTKVRVGGKLAATLGLGTGGSASVELDATVLITGVDLDRVDQQMKAADGILAVVRGLKDGSLKLPPGKTFAEIREQLVKQAEWYAKHPQKDAKGKTIDLADSLKKDLGLQKGKGGGYVTAHHKQSDWYCTNRPVINAPVALPPIVRKD